MYQATSDDSWDAESLPACCSKFSRSNYHSIAAPYWPISRYHEATRLAERHLKFNVHELCNIIARSVGQRSDDINVFTKLAEGGCYRVFEATFRDGLKVIARLPYTCSLPLKYGTASEVATMEFLRLHGVPTPRVFDWSDSSTNSIGSEYIVMERVAGTELEKSWYTMSLKERMVVMEKIVGIERILFTIEFPACGSLFFDKSLIKNIDRTEIIASPDLKNAPKFCIGPSTAYCGGTRIETVWTSTVDHVRNAPYYGERTR